MCQSVFLCLRICLDRGLRFAFLVLMNPCPCREALLCHHILLCSTRRSVCT